MKSAAKYCTDDTLADLYFFGENYGKAPWLWQRDKYSGRTFLDKNLVSRILAGQKDSNYQNFKKALYWYHRCAKKWRITSSMTKLAYLYETGICVERNMKNAQYWHDAEKRSQLVRKIFFE